MKQQNMCTYVENNDIEPLAKDQGTVNIKMLSKFSKVTSFCQSVKNYNVINEIW